MRVILPVREFRDVFGRVAPAAAKRTPKPILCNILMTVDESRKATLQATDLESGVVDSIQLGPECDPGSILLPAAKIAELLRIADPAESIELADDGGGKLRIAVGRTRLTFATEDTALFPTIVDQIADAPGFTLSAPDLVRMARLAFIAADPAGTNSRFALSGALVEFEDGRLILTCADGRQAAVATRPATKVGEPPRSILTRTLMQHAERLPGAADPDAVATLGLGRSFASVRIGGSIAWGRLVEGRFPILEPITATKFPAATTVAAHRLLDAVRLAALGTTEDSRGVDLGLDGDGFTFRAASSAGAESEVHLVADWTAPPTATCIDHRFLTAFLAAVGDEDVALAVVGGNDPVRVVADTATLWFMPLIGDTVAANRGQSPRKAVA